jgi:hypothetical protein
MSAYSASAPVSASTAAPREKKPRIGIGEESGRRATDPARAAPAGFVGDADQAEYSQGQEPEHHDRPEKRAHRGGSVTLNREQTDQDDQRDRQT